MGFTTVLTLSGVTKEADLDHYGYSPDFIIKSIKDLLDEDFFTRVLEKVSEPSYMFDKKMEENTTGFRSGL